MSGGVRAKDRKSFRDRLDQAASLARMKGARFADDTPQLQLQRKARAVVLPEYFNAQYLQHYFRSAPAGFHLELYRALEVDRRILVRAPRGHAKSTVVTFAYTTHQVVCAEVLREWVQGTLQDSDPALFAAIEQVRAEVLAERQAAWQAELDAPGTSPARVRELLANEPRAPRLWWDPYIQIVSVTSDQATEFTEAIRIELEDNELVHYDWGKLTVSAGVSDYTAKTPGSKQSVRVKAFGMMGGIRGGKHGPWRPTLTIIDDPDEAELTCATRKTRDRSENKLTRAINYGLEPKVSRVMMLATPVHEDCLACRISKPDKYKRWRKLRFKAIREDGTPLWPERWTLEALREEEDENPEAFQMEMMDTPPSSGATFHTIHYYDREQFQDPLPKVMVFDPAVGQSDTSDFQAVVLLRGPVPKLGWLLLHRVELLRIGDPFELVTAVNGIYDEERPDIAYVEAIGFQKFLEMMLTAQGNTTGLFPGWIPIDRQTVNKQLRIKGTAPLVNRGVLRFPSDRSCRVTEGHYLDFPHDKVDDLDGIEMAIREMRQVGAGARGAGRIRHIRGRGFGFRRGAW